MKKLITIISVSIMLVLFAFSVSAEENDTYTVVIPEYITTNECSVDTITEHSVLVKDVSLSNSDQYVNVAIDYSQELQERDFNISLDYGIFENGSRLNKEDFVLRTKSNASASISSKLNDSPIYSGIYMDTAVFNIYVERKQFTPEEIEADPHVYGIGATKREYVVAVFNDDYSKVEIYKNGPHSDGLMVDWVNNKTPFELPMFTYKNTLKSATVCEGVKNIGDYAFITSGITSISLPNSLESIGYYSFRQSKLTSIQLNEGLKKIGYGAFYSAEAIKGDLIIPDSVEIIDHYAFRYCYGFNGALHIGDGVKFLGNFAFDGGEKVTNYTSLYIGENVEYIGTACFQCMERLTNAITIPDKVKVIGDFAFNHMNTARNITLHIPASVVQIGGTYNLPNCNYDNFMEMKFFNIGSHNFYDFGRGYFEAFDVDPDNPNYKDIDGVLFTKDGKRLISYPSSKHGTYYEIPEGVEIMDEMTFSCYSSGITDYITTLVIPDSYTIVSWDDMNPKVLNCYNSLTNAVYRFCGVEEYIIKDTNPRYTSIDGVIYTKDLKTCLAIPTQKRDVRIVDGCETIDACMFATETMVKGDKTFHYYFPASVKNFVCNNESVYPKENIIYGLNAMAISTKLNCTIEIDSTNPYYYINSKGQIAKY